MIDIRSDLFVQRKGVHVKLEKHVHADFRAKLFRHSLTMQEVFEEFAKLFVDDNVWACRMVENLVMKKIEAKSPVHKPKKAENLLKKNKRQSKSESINELDHDALYNLIEESTKKDEII